MTMGAGQRKGCCKRNRGSLYEKPRGLGSTDFAREDMIVPKAETTFSHPDYTVGSGISPDPALVTRARGLSLMLRHHHRSGIAPRALGANAHPAPKVIPMKLSLRLATSR